MAESCTSCLNVMRKSLQFGLNIRFFRVCLEIRLLKAQDVLDPAGHKRDRGFDQQLL